MCKSNTGFNQCVVTLCFNNSNIHGTILLRAIADCYIHHSFAFEINTLKPLSHFFIFIFLFLLCLFYLQKEIAELKGHSSIQ